MKRLLIAALLLVPIYAQEEATSERVSESTGVTEHSPWIGWGWINFLLLAGGLGYIVKKNAGPYFAQRTLTIRKGMIEADEARAEADAKVAEVDRRLAGLESEIAELRQEARAEADAEAQRIARESDSELAKIRQHVEDEIAAAGKGARLELRRYSAQLALELAEQKIAARLTPETQDRLVHTFTARLTRPL
ncbi:MAG: ATP synthase F0 subunit B [Bryobacteraceae bacterium]